jgi:hypothetical protein
MRKVPEERFGRAYDRAMGAVVAQFGKDIFTREECTERKLKSRHGLSRLSKRANAAYENIRSIRDLARRMSLDDLFDLGCSVMSANAFCQALHMRNVDPLDWLNGSVGSQEKVSSAYEKNRRRKLKARNGLHLAHGNRPHRRRANAS